MRIDPEDLRRHYESLPDEELLALEREDLTEMARPLYDQEMARRGLTAEQDENWQAEPGDQVEPFDSPGEVEEGTEDDSDVDGRPAPDWIENAGCVWTFDAHPGAPDQTEAVRTVLRAAGIPCHISLTRVELPRVDATERHEYRVMVPSRFSMQAVSVLDRDMFNEKQEEGWRAQFEALSDQELLAQNPEILCAGLLDQVARLKKAYQDEVARRGLKRR